MLCKTLNVRQCSRTWHVPSSKAPFGVTSPVVARYRSSAHDEEADDGTVTSDAKRRRRAKSSAKATNIGKECTETTAIRLQGEEAPVSCNPQDLGAPTHEDGRGNTRHVPRTKSALWSSIQRSIVGHTTRDEYLAHAEANDVSQDSNTYQGTIYEYTVMETLHKYGFYTCRVGARDDRGIDLLGHWYLPGERQINVLIQCKRTKPMPSMIRELGGTGSGAPARWAQDSDCMSFLVACEPATSGVRDALQRSHLPMAFAQVTPGGLVRQFLWNHAATTARLTGLTTTTKYSVSGDGGNVSTISLSWLGKQCTDRASSKQIAQRCERLDREVTIARH